MCDFLRVFMLRRAKHKANRFTWTTRFFSFFKIFPSLLVVFVDFPLVPHILVTRLCYPIPLFSPFACHFIPSLRPNFPPSFPFASGLSASFHKPQLAISPCPDLRKLVPLQAVFPIFWYSNTPSYRTRYFIFYYSSILGAK